jgi:multiple sugar transport system ATP-binding protein
MNFLRFEGSFRPGDTGVTLGGVRIGTPEMREEAGGRKLVLGVRPEHVALRDDGAYRGRIEASEYLGTTQIVTLSTPHGMLKVRAPSGQAARVGETVGLAFTASTLALFDEGTGRAFRTAANAGVHHG